MDGSGQRMLNKPNSPSHASQKGVVMLVALIVLVVMTLAGIALMRSTDTSNLIAGNMAFKQAATHSADQGIEAAIAWLEANNSSGLLDTNSSTVGYTASTLSNVNYQTGESFWTQLTPSGVCYLPIAGGVCAAAPGVADASGNLMAFMIQRLCRSAGSRNGAGCAVANGAIISSGGGEGAGDDAITATATSIYYRITVRVVGPRNTVSYIQSIVSM